MRKLQTPLLFLAAIAAMGLGITHEFTATSGPDYCALANARSCKVTNSGEWTMLSMPDGTTALVLTRGGRVVQVLR